MIIQHLARLSAVAVLSVTAMAAANFSFTGTLTNDNQVQLFTFSTATAGTVTFQSYGYGGGLNFAGSTIPAGGFDSYFTWFNAADGSQISTDNDSCGSANSTPNGCSDAFFSGFLDAGSYVLALTVSGNGPNGGLYDGFAQDSTPNFTCEAGFCDSFSDTRTGNWAVDILTVDEAAAAPEPTTFLLLPAGLMAAGLRRRRAARQ